MQTRTGHIITMASMASYATVATTTDYAASKAGVLAFHEGVWGVMIACDPPLVWLSALAHDYRTYGCFEERIQGAWSAYHIDPP